MKKTMLKVYLAAVCVLIIDQFSKWLAINYLKTPLALTDWFSLRFEQNTGIAWSLPLPINIILPLNLLLLFFVIAYMPKILDLRRKETVIALSFVIGGGMGNICDRISYGYVVDFISVGWWPVFNLADAFLCIGIFLIILFYGTIRRQSR